MGSSIKINSISIDLADEVNAGKCEHFSIRGFVAEVRERDHRKCWPFAEDTVELVNDQSYSLPSLPVHKSRWWRCASCIRDIHAKEINNDSDCRLQSHSRETKLDVLSSAIPSKRKPNSLIVTDKKEKKNNVRTATLLKKVRRGAKDASTLKSKNRKLASPEQISKRSREKTNLSREIMETVTAFGSSEIAGVVDDTPDKTIKRYTHVSTERGECDNVSPESRNLLGLHRRKTRKVRLLSELLSNGNKEALSKRESVRGRKRKYSGDAAEMSNYASRILSTIGKTSENASKSCDSEDNTVSGADSRPIVENESTDSGFDREIIKGKKRNRKFQVVEDCFPETSQKDPYHYASNVQSSFAGKELVPCPLHTERTEKELSLAKKRKRKAMKDNKTSTVITFSNDMDDVVKLRKPDNFPRNTMPQSTRDFLNSKWLDSSLDKFLASDGHFNKYTPQLNDRLPLQEEMHYKEGGREMLKGIGTNHFQNFGSSFKSTNADGCLRTGVNVNFSSNRDTIISSSLNDKIRHTSSTEVADTSCALQKDFSLAHGKGKEVAVQELSVAHRSQCKTSEHIDDIPMEIVELMAKNQYERCLPDREEDKQPSQATTSVSKNALLIDLNETYDNSMDNTVRQPKPLGQNARNSDAAHFMTGKQSSLECFPTSYNVSFGVGNPPLTRDKQPSSVQFSGVLGPNSQWLGHVPTTMANQQNPSPSSYRVLRACNTCQSVQQQQFREASHPVWPSSLTSSPAHKPVSLSMQKFMDQPIKLGNPNTLSLNFSDNGKQKLGFEGVSSRPLDTYSNESSIPAMHLLSLMDPRLRSNVPVDQSRNTNFVKRPFCNQSKEFAAPRPEDCNQTAYSTKQWPFDLYSKTSATPEPCRENFSIIPPVGTSSISFQSEKISAGNAVFTPQASWNHHQEKKPKRKDKNFAPVYNNSKPIFTSSSSSEPGKFQLLGASDSMMLPLKFHMTDNAKKQKTKKAQCNNDVSACPPRSISGPYVCSVNRNPADFTIPDAPGNVYMIKGEDLKVKKHPGFKKKSSLYKQDVLKQNNSIAPNIENA
ncbi:hypothetical protein EUTSA_v10003568mg [Eutrema salsugineum]|uniref:Protein EMBRYONIC FLOWER 1 n=1 Tax=Eutrema salsugineum TaxID=72664 RepID=V4K3Q2_EUTSA|nr:protein EMBRYONIC FLOWER 1 [Eutrema salsugineum]ESQ32115.1 hypothetical protein EUTSA_v10003568mg [Eutrema salsugineum]